MFKCLLILSLSASALACIPGAEKEIGYLESLFGLKAPDGANGPNGALNTGFSNEAIAAASDLDCDFSDIATCAWTNLANTPANQPVYTSFIDRNADFFLFEKSSSTKFTYGVLPGGPTRTPDTGEKFVLAGAKSPVTKAVWYSSPVLCLRQPGRLDFDYWLFGGSGMRVHVLSAADPSKVLYSQPDHECTASVPQSGRCSASIPRQNQPFHLAIQAHTLVNNFALVDNIKFVADLEPDCANLPATTPDPGPPFDFGTTSSPLSSGATGRPIDVSDDLLCFDADSSCQWKNANSGGPQWLTQSSAADINRDKWQAAFNTDVLPTGDFMQVDATSGEARLLSDPIECQENPGFVQFHAWLSPGAHLSVCPVDADTLQPIGACVTVERNPPDQQYFVEVGSDGDQTTNMRIMFKARDGHVALDDIEYAAVLCDPEPVTVPHQTTTTTPAPVEECRAITCNFNAENTCQWDAPPQASRSSPWEPRTGRTGNPLTGIRQADGAYLATYIYQGEATSISTTLPRGMQKEHALSFDYFEAAYDLRVRGCCQTTDQCPFESEIAAYPASRQWRHDYLTCPEGTNKIIFLCENFGQNQGACGLDNIEVVNAATKLPLCS